MRRVLSYVATGIVCLIVGVSITFSLCDKVVDENNREWSTLVDQAYSEGYNEGYNDGEHHGAYRTFVTILDVIDEYGYNCSNDICKYMDLGMFNYRGCKLPDKYNRDIIISEEVQDVKGMLQ